MKKVIVARLTREQETAAGRDHALCALKSNYLRAPLPNQNQKNNLHKMPKNIDRRFGGNPHAYLLFVDVGDGSKKSPFTLEANIHQLLLMM